MAGRLHEPDHPEYGLPDPVWPQDLLLPSRPPQLLYLDLNHWIGLARAERGTGRIEYVKLLTTLRTAIGAGRVRVVLTGSLFREVAKIADPRQRAILTELIGELTDYTYLGGLPDIFRLELQAVLNADTGTRGLRFGPVELLGQSALHSMGRVGGLRIMQDGADVTAAMIANYPTFEDRLAKMNRLAEQMLLAGPSDAEIPALRADGYQPEVPEKQVRDNAAFEQAWSATIPPYRSTHSVRDLVIARHLTHELLDMLTHELIARGLTIGQMFSEPADGRWFVMRMPSSAVMVSLIAQYHQDPNKMWTQNDMYAIDALAAAVPYCDIVLTDAAARDALLRRHLDVIMATALPRRPQDLALLLNQTSGPSATA